MKDIEFTFGECKEKVLCYDCKNEKCIFHGKKEADCPKWLCDNPMGLANCDECDFIDEYIKDARKWQV